MKSVLAVGIALMVCLTACTSGSPATPTVKILEPPTITGVSTIFDVGGVEVFWEYDPAEDVTIEIQRSNSPDGPWEVFGSRNNVTEPWPVGRTGLGFNHTLWFRAFAVKDGMRSEPSAVKSGSTGPPFPMPSG